MVKCEETSSSSGLHHKAKTIISEDAIIPHSGGRRNSNGFLEDRTGSDVQYGFRLQDHTDSGSIGLERGSVTSASVYSFYKQRIDSMFDETRSQMSYQLGSTSRRETAQSIFRPENDQTDDKQDRINNAIQARIEKMFAEMADEKNATRKLKAETQTRKSISYNQFSVDYLGSVALPDKVTSLQGLQEPLRDLYFGYCRMMQEKGHSSKRSEKRKGTLEISGNGLKVQHTGNTENERVEQLNPFSNIAVWAAIKFVCRRKPQGNDMEYAFLPLIADPEAIDKGALFKPLNRIDQKVIQAMDNPEIEKDPSYNHHSPLFAVVMRTMGPSKQLECHGFVCSHSEDAIVIAANLYQALMVHMQSRNRRNSSKSGEKPSRGPTNRNGISYVSLGGGSSICGGELNDTKSVLSSREDVTGKITKSTNNVINNLPSTSGIDNNDVVDTVKKRPTSTKIPPPVPVRPPRKKNRSSASSASEDENIITRVITPPPTLPKPEMKRVVVAKETEAASRARVAKETDSAARARHSRSESEPCAGTPSIYGPSTGVRRVASDLHGYNSINLASDYPETGDILTKVAIPRSKSFLNAGGPLTRYNRRQSTGVGYGNGPSSGGNGSPLGFNELFAEFRAQEGLNSLDDILDAIIDAEGMSFNDLKPIYKEFLLKLAVTLTKDELYQRSKSIMRRQRKKLNRRNSMICVKRKKTPGVGLKKVFRRSVSKLKAAKSRPSSFEFTSVLFPSSAPIGSSKKLRSAFPEDSTTSTSTSSYNSRNFQLNRQPSLKVGVSKEFRIPRRLSTKKKRTSPMQRRSRHQHSASEDSDFFSMARPTGMNNGQKQENTTLVPNRSSSGYFSFSECSYDSESCTCTSADKCYCSMGEGRHTRRRRSKSTSAVPRKECSFSSCGFDTDSCVESDKCYCALEQSHHHHRKPSALSKRPSSVFDQLKQRGFAISDTSLSRAASPTTAWRKNEGRIHTKHNSVGGSVKSYKSLEFLQMNPTPRRNEAWNSRRTRSDESAGYISKRMDGYESQSRQTVYHLPSDFKREQGRSYSSDNLALDYDLFNNSSKSEEDEDKVGTGYPPPQSKVLVVSARDPRGRIIYMGASCRSDDGSKKGSKRLPTSSGSNSSRYAGRRRRHHSSDATSTACEALSVKKSAEIAALFADMKLSQTTGVVVRTEVGVIPSVGQKGGGGVESGNTGEAFYNTLEPPEYFFSKRTGRSYLGGSLENSLGYLP